MSSKNKPTIEGARISTTTGKVVLSGSVSIDGARRKHYYACSISTIEEARRALKNPEIVGPIALEIVPEYVLYINLKRVDSDTISGFEKWSVGEHTTPQSFEKSMWQCAKNYFEKYDSRDRKRRIEESGMTINLILRRLYKIPYEIGQAQKVEDDEHGNMLENALIGIGKIIGCPKTSHNLAALLTTTDQTLMRLCKKIPLTVFDPKGILYARRVYEEQFLEIRRTTDYAKVYSALVDAHVQRMAELTLGNYEAYAGKGEEISKLFSMIQKMNPESGSIEDTYKEPPLFKSEEED